jgi:hypothetical protein
MIEGKNPSRWYSICPWDWPLAAILNARFMYHGNCHVNGLVHYAGKPI